MSVAPPDRGELENSGWIGLPGVVFRPGDGLLEIGETSHPLTPKASGLLLKLVLAYPHAAPREELLDALWGHGRGSPETIAQVIAELRRKLGDEARSPRYIRTVSKVGFQLLVEPIALARADADVVSAEAALIDGSGETAVEVSPRPPAAVHGVTAKATRRWNAIAAVALVTVGLALAASAWWQRSETTDSANALRLQVIADDAVIETMPRLVANGSKLIYALHDPVSGDLDIAMRDLQQARPQVIARAGSDESSPILSADQKLLAFVRQSGDQCLLMLSDPSGGRERVVAECAPAAPGQLIDMSAGGELLAYTAPTNAEHQSRAVNVIEASSGSLRFQTDAFSPLHTDYGPRLSADQQRLSFFRHDYQTGEAGLRLFHQGQSQPLVAPAGEVFVAHSWSPGDRFYVIATDGGNARLLELALPSGALKRVIASIPDGRNLSYDGQRFVYSTALVGDTYLAKFDFDAPDPAPSRVTSARSGHSLPQLNDTQRTLLFAAQANQNAEVWATDLAADSTTRLASYSNSKLLALQWRWGNAEIEALMVNSAGDTELLRIAYPSGAELARQPCAGAQAFVAAPEATDSLLRDQHGRYFRNCGDLSAADSAARAISTDAMVLRPAGVAGWVANLQSSTGLWALDQQLQPTQRLSDYRRGADYSWAVNGHWLVRLQQDERNPTALRITRTDLRDGTEIAIAANQLDLSAGVELSADGLAYAVLNQMDDIDIVMLEWSEAEHR